MTKLFTKENIELLKCPASMFFAVGLGVVSGDYCSGYLQEKLPFLHPVASNIAVTSLFYLIGVLVAHLVSLLNNAINTSGIRTKTWLDSIRGILDRTKVALTFSGRKRILKSFNTLSKKEKEELLADLTHRIQKGS